MELFLIRLTPYKENDFIITSLSPDGLVTFKAVGLSKPSSKLAGVVTLYSLIEAELEEKKSGYVIKSAKGISKNYKIISDYDKLSVLNFIGELCLRSINSEDEARQLYPIIKTLLLTLENTSEPFTLAFIAILKVLQTIGYGLNIDSCVECGTHTDIVAIDYSRGGFVCRAHFNHMTSLPLSVEALKAIRHASLIPMEKINDFMVKKETLKVLFDGVISFYKDATNVQLKSYSILRELLVH